METIIHKLKYRPPYVWDKLLEFLAGRAIPGVELIRGNIYRRTVVIKAKDAVYRGWVSVANRPRENYLTATVCNSLLPVMPEVLARIRKLFDVDCNPVKINSKLSVLNELAPNTFIPGIRLPGCFDAFEISVRAVLGQQITIKAAQTLAMRFAHAFGGTIETPFRDLQYTFPNPETIYRLGPPVEAQLGSLGITSMRSRAIFALAEAIETGIISFAPEADPETELKKLLQLPGFGPWTVQYIGMRAFSWADAFPYSDYGVKKALAPLTEKEILQRSQKWRPWRAYATLCLWDSLKNK